MKHTVAIVFILLSMKLTAQINWPAVTNTAKPWTRWWWIGSAVDEAGISKQINELSDAGFGGVEIVPIYGAIGFEKKYINYLSPQWMKMLDYTVASASAKQMGVDISVGTGWPIGGPQVTAEDAATKLIVQEYALKAGEVFKDTIAVSDVKQKGMPGVFLAAVMAYDEEGATIDITDKVTSNGILKWQPQKGNWQLFAAFVGKTKQLVKRAAPGGEGYTLDHFSQLSIKNYFKTFDTAFGNSKHGVRSFFNDSYEVYNADWSPSFFAAFKQRRGYNLKLFIKQLTSKSTDEITARVKCDYRETISELMLQNFTQKFTAWAHSKGALNTNQAHGSPANLLDLYGAVDIPESETYGSTAFSVKGLKRDSFDVRNVDPDPNMLRFASSAANVYGKQLITNETFTWLTEHFKTSWSQCKPEVENVFLSGINHVFYHGTTYTPADLAFPGWLFYASVNFVPFNSLWGHLKGLNEYITRCQTVLQTTKPNNEILTYWPVYDVWMTAEKLDLPLSVHTIQEWLHPTKFYKNLTTLQGKGYTLDFASDKMLNEAFVQNSAIKVSNAGAAYKILLVPQAQYMPVSTLQNIIRLAKNGATVVLQGFPGDVPGLSNLENERNRLKEIIDSVPCKIVSGNIKQSIIGKGKIVVCENLEEALQFIRLQRENLTDDGLQFVRRSFSEGKYYYIVNHTAAAIDKQVTLATNAASVVLMNPQTGETGITSLTKVNNSISLKIQLQSGEAVIVKASVKKIVGKQWRYIEKPMEPIILNNEWNLHFTMGGPFIPSDKTMKMAMPWTIFSEDTTTQSFSGTGVYKTSFQLHKKNADDYILCLDKLYESASVIVNGQEAGIIWSNPFKLSIGKYLKQGENTIEVEVCNLMANRIRNMDINKLEWRKYHEINFVNINYKKFDASAWKVQPSGLEGIVKIVPVKYLK